jgi:hypothetical protein
VDELGIEALESGEDEEMPDGDVIPHFGFKLGVGIAPLLCDEGAEENDEEIRFGSADNRVPGRGRNQLQTSQS